MKKRVMIGRERVDENTLLLLHFDGDFIDAKGNFNLINSGAVINHSHMKFGNGSAYFKNGILFFQSKQWLADLLASGNYTVDFWMKYIFYAGTSVEPFSDDYNVDTTGFMLNMERGTSNNFIRWGNYSSFVSYGFLNYYNNYDVWNHIAVTCKDGHTRIFINGQKLAERSSYYPYLKDHKLCIGGRDGYDANCDGYYDEFRISNIARWTSNFTPPTKPY